jgi:predicted enzyme involved in methoxymalonyl-ACP biosynthesis
MGRGVEYSFMHHLAEDLSRLGFKQLTAAFTPTQKNKPASDFLASLDFTLKEQVGETIRYSIQLEDLINDNRQVNKSITINAK